MIGQVMGGVLYYVRVVYTIVLVALSTTASEQTTVTETLDGRVL